MKDLLLKHAGDDIASGIIHGVFLALALFFLILVLLYPLPDADRQTALLIFLCGNILFFIISILHHGLSKTRAWRVFLVLDQSSFFLIQFCFAVPFVLYKQGPWNWGILAALALLSLLGILYQIFLTAQQHLLPIILHVFFFWLFFSSWPLFNPVFSVKQILFFWGGLALTAIGIPFLVKQKVASFHSLWHFFFALTFTAFFAAFYFIS